MDIIDDKRISLRGSTGTHSGGEPVTTTAEGHAIILRSPRPVIVGRVDVDNKGADGAGANSSDVDWTLYSSATETNDPDARSWHEVNTGTVAAGGHLVDEFTAGVTGCFALMLVVEIPDAGSASQGVRPRLTGTV